MKRILLTAALAAGIAAADACAILWCGNDPNAPFNRARLTPPTLVGEHAIIVWDPATKQQHFIRQASFEGNSEDFGFIVPTPTLPTVVKSDQKAFQAMYFSGPSLSRGTGGTAAAAGGGGGGASFVTVVDQYEVGDYQAAILKATDGRAIMAWLKKHGYDSRPAFEDWLDYYTKKKYYFAALKLIRDPRFTTNLTSAIRISFKSSRPYYPYKMPSDTFPAGHIRPLTLSVISTGQATASYVGTKTPWEAETWESSDLGISRISLAQAIGIPEEQIPSDARITRFTNSTNQHGYSRDLQFQVDPVSAMTLLEKLANS